MTKYVIERQYLLPVYQRRVVEGDTVEEACEKAIDHDVWEDAVEDGDSARATSINAVKRIPGQRQRRRSRFRPRGPDEPEYLFAR
jgi:hypothetical protein